ncbi:hypothetical protein NGC53_02505 [Aerococcus viridans]|uniref:hypothetical protein n=1 Tax=Aerococcus viridans TaxID=1377 RepID=UPI002DB8C4CE|nr:hypothetical protein [Aerococcus viridans]MEB7388690.1 hypothetical protein [Aerococcus viridans]
MTDEQFKHLIESASNKVLSLPWNTIFTIIALVISYCSLRQSVKSAKENKANTIESEYNKYFLFIEDLYKFYEEICEESTIDNEDKTIIERFNTVHESTKLSEVKFNDLASISVPIKYRDSFRDVINNYWNLNKQIKKRYHNFVTGFLNYDDLECRRIDSKSALMGLKNDIRLCLEEVEKLRFKNLK